MTSYTSKVGKEICDRIAGGETLTAICQDTHMPPAGTVHGWVLDENADTGFRESYMLARLIQAHQLRDKLLDTAENDLDDGGKYGNNKIQRAKLQCDTFKWLLSKELARNYGDKLDVIQSGEVTQKRIVIVKTFDDVKIRDTPSRLGEN